MDEQHYLPLDRCNGKTQVEQSYLHLDRCNGKTQDEQSYLQEYKITKLFMNLLFLTLKITFLLFKSIKCLSHLGWINWLLLNIVKTNEMMKLICINKGKNIYWLLCVHYYQMSLWTGNVVRMSTLKRNGLLWFSIYYISPYYASNA